MGCVIDSGESSWGCWLGVAVPKGARALRLTLDEILEDGANEMNGLARMTIARAQAQWRELDEHLAWCDERMAA